MLSNCENVIICFFFFFAKHLCVALKLLKTFHFSKLLSAQVPPSSGIRYMYEISKEETE